MESDLLDDDYTKDIDLSRHEKAAKRIGGKYGMISGAIGLTIAQLLFTFILTTGGGMMNNFFWFLETGFGMNLLVGVMILFLLGNYVGQKAGKAIIVRKINAGLIGVLTGCTVLVLTVFFASWYGFFQEGIKNTGSIMDAFIAYVARPTIAIGMFGGLPAIIIGLWFGYTVKRKGERLM